jgi:hypothetical protein
MKDENKAAMPEDQSAAHNDKPTTLSDSEISSERNVSRRSLLGAIGIGTGVFAATIFGGTNSAEARRVCDRNAYDRCFDTTDSDPRDGAGDRYDRR